MSAFAAPLSAPQLFKIDPCGADTQHMGPPSSGRGKRLPTLSWDSIVDDASETTELSERQISAAQPPVPSAPEPLLSTDAASVSLSVDSLSIKPLKIEPLPIDSMSLGPLPTDPSPVEPVSTPTPPPPPAPPTLVSAPEVLEVTDEPAAEDPEISGQIVPALRVVAPTPIIPALGTIEPGPADVRHDVGSADATDVLPQIVEATPSPGVPAIVQAPASVVAPPAEYSLPRIPQPDQSQMAPIRAQSPLAVAYSEPLQSHTRARSGRGVLLVVTLVFLGGLVAAGIVFGRPYLFPEDQQATAGADPVSANGTPELVVTAEPTAQFTARLTSELAGDWASQQPQWRALGLLSGTVTDDVVSDLLTGWQDAVYVTGEGQVYYDEVAVGDSLDTELELVTASASLDQEFGWSAGQDARTLDDAALTLAAVFRQSLVAQQASESSGEIEARNAAPLVFLPPILGYQILAPHTFAEFDSGSTDGPNVLSLLDQAGPGPLASEVLIDAAAPIVVDGDQVVGSPTAMDSSFWYLVFAGYVENTAARAASESIVENSLVTADRGGTRCMYATFSGGDVGQTATLRGTIETWSANVPAEFDSSTSVLPDGTLQFVSCDPGQGFENQSRLGTARELVGWRIAELATIEAVMTAGGSGADLAAALSQIEASNVGEELAILPLDVSSPEAADAARTAVAAVLGISAD